MSINSFFKFFTPKDKVFYPLFYEISENMVKISKLLNDCVNNNKYDRDDYISEISKTENKIEYLTQKTNLELGKNFITPFDREDIYQLVKSIDYVAHNLNGAASKIHIYKVDEITNSIKKMAAVNLDACILIEEGVKQLNKLYNINRLYEICEKINKLETKSDRIFDEAIQELFEKEQDAKNIIKYKEVLYSLKSAMDRCKSVSNIMEVIIVKHS